MAIALNRVQIQLTSTIYFIRKVIEYADPAMRKITENLLGIMRPDLMDFHEQSWIEAATPYVDYLYNMYQTKSNQSQFYDNFSFRNDSFSLPRFNKQLRHVLSVLIDSSLDDKKTVENSLIMEENETTEKMDESEWSSNAKTVIDIIAEV